MVTIGTMLVSLALGFVYYARSTLLFDQLAQNAIIGGEQPSGIWFIGGSMLGNVIVWLLGIALAFFTHDEDHNFPSALKQKNKSRKKMDDISESLQKPLNRAFERIDAQCTKQIEQARNMHNAMAVEKSFREGRELFDQIKDQDSRVVAAFEQYRLKLTNPRNGMPPEFECQEEMKFDVRRKLDAREYAAQTLSLKYL
jgi:hypothetical protein